MQNSSAGPFRSERTAPGTFPPIGRRSSSQSTNSVCRSHRGSGGVVRRDVFDSSASIPQHEQDWAQESKAYYESTPMACYLPFKLFRSASTEPIYRRRRTPDTYGGSMSAMAMRPHPSQVNQMDQFISETAQSMVGFHCQKCLPVLSPGQKIDLYKMQTLADIMKKHKDAFHSEYEEFGPVSEWKPTVSSSALRVPVAARHFASNFGLRGELATLTHVGRAHCRLRAPTPPLLFRPRVPTPVGCTNGPNISQSAPFSDSARAGELPRKEELDMNPTVYVPAAHAAGVPSSLQGLFMPTVRNGVTIVKSVPVVFESN